MSKHDKLVSYLFDQLREAEIKYSELAIKRLEARKDHNHTFYDHYFKGMVAQRKVISSARESYVNAKRTQDLTKEVGA